jgi:hypothetical protein
MPPVRIGNDPNLGFSPRIFGSARRFRQSVFSSSLQSVPDHVNTPVAHGKCGHCSRDMLVYSVEPSQRCAKSLVSKSLHLVYCIPGVDSECIARSARNDDSHGRTAHNGRSLSNDDKPRHYWWTRNVHKRLRPALQIHHCGDPSSMCHIIPAASSDRFLHLFLVWSGRKAFSIFREMYYTTFHADSIPDEL